MLTLRRIAHEFCPDLVIYSNVQFLLMGSRFLPNLKSIFYLHDKPGGLLASRFAGAVGKRVDRVVCCSNYVAACLSETLLDAKKIVAVHYGIESPSTSSERIQSQTIRLGIVGQVLPRKQHLLLIKALERLKARSLEFPFSLKIIGKKEGPYAQDVDELVEQLNLREVVEWVGFRSVRDDIYRDLDIVVAAATDEPFGLTVIEAGAYGLPVVAARSGGFPELVIDGTTGLLFDAGDVASLAAALEKLIIDCRCVAG